VPARVPARLFAVSRYVLFVNGVEVARGPMRSNPRSQYYDVVDLGPYLRQGANVIGILAVRYGSANAWWLPPPATANDLGAGALVFEARLANDRLLVSDGSWTATQLDGWESTPGPEISGRGEEIHDLRTLPPGWAEPGRPAPEWRPALQRLARTAGETGSPQPPSYPGGPYAERPIGWPVPKRVSLEADGDGGLTSDGVVVGTVVVDAEIPAGARLTIRAAEFLDADGRPEPRELDASMVVIGDGTRRILESLDIYGMQGLQLGVPDGARVHDVFVRERLYPMTGDAGFECSDPGLNRIYEVGRRTVSLCSLDAYVDCPTREQRAWVGDAVVHQMVDLTTNTDWRLARWYPRLAASPRPDGMLPMAVAGEVEDRDFTVIPDWALHWVHAVHNLYRYTGDRELVAELLPAVEGVVRWFSRFVDPNGLPRDVVGWVIIDWSSVYTAGISAALCGLWGRALLEFAEMSEWLGDNGRAGWARETQAQLAAGFERLWDAGAGRYCDSLVDGVLEPMASQHGQAAAIVGGLAPADRFSRLVEVMTDEANLVHAAFSAPDGPAAPNSGIEVGGGYLRVGRPDPWWKVETQVVRAQPFFRYVVHDALVEAGRADLVVSQCRDWMVALERCPTSWTETWYGGTISHAWSSTPTRDLVQRVLGVTPAEPGFKVARIEPNLGDLEWAEGAVPTPDGMLRVRVSKLELVVESPVPFIHAGRRYQAGAVTVAL
jgi:alpha-L-rhamnosidase